MNPHELDAALNKLSQRALSAWLMAIVVPLLLLGLCLGLLPRLVPVQLATMGAGALLLFACLRARAENERLKLQRARLLHQGGRPEEALDIYQSLYQGERHHEWTETAHYRLAELYDQQGQGPLALGHYREYLKRYKRGRWKLEAQERISVLERGGPIMGATPAPATSAVADFADLRARKRKAWALGLSGIPAVLLLGGVLFPVVPFALFPVVGAPLFVLLLLAVIGGPMFALYSAQRCDLEAASRLAQTGRDDEALAIYERIKTRFIGRKNGAEGIIGPARIHERRGERMAALLAYRDYVERFPQGQARVEAASRLRELERDVDAPPPPPLPLGTGSFSLRENQPVPSPVSSGQRVGEYILEEPLGRGGFGEVWKARHNSLPGVVVAMKFPTAPEALEGLRRLGQIQHQLDHPRIVKTLGMDPDGHPPYVTMNYVEGESLRQLLQRQGRLPRERALRLFDQLLSAVAHAHGRGVVHRDLKPENVLIDKSGDALVTDFELGQVTADFTRQLILSGSLATQDGRSISGTFLYMAPEQRQGEAVDPRSDLYPLGIMLFEMLTGELPQPGDKLADFLPDLPVELEEVFARCYTRRERRYSTVEELRVAFGAACALSPAGSA